MVTVIKSALTAVEEPQLAPSVAVVALVVFAAKIATSAVKVIVLPATRAAAPKEPAATTVIVEGTAAATVVSGVTLVSVAMDVIAKEANEEDATSAVVAIVKPTEPEAPLAAKLPLKLNV
jgi:hypothetical protein